MNPSQTQTAPEKPGRAPAAADGPKANGEHPSFNPGAIWRGEPPAAAGEGASAAEAPARSGGLETSEAATTFRQAAMAIVSMQAAGVQMLNEWLWRTASLAAMPTLAPANPFKGFGLPLQGLPPADVKETPQGYSLCVELPGLEAGDVDIRINGDVLTVSGQKGEVEEETRPTYLISERRFGRFERSFPIPPDVERSGIAATFRDGVLSIALPREAGPPAHEEASPAA